MRIVFVFLCLLPSAFGQHIMEAIESNPPDKMVVGMTFNEGAGAKDWSQYSNDGVVTAAVFTPGAHGGAYRFGTWGQHIKITDHASLNSTNNGTIAFWVYGVAEADNDNIAWKTSEYGMSIGFGVLGGAAGKYNMIIRQASPAAWIVANSTTDAVNGVWTHVVGTWDGINVRIYHNGSLEGTAVGGPTTVQPVNLWIGESSVQGREYDGLIADVRVYARTLSLVEIQELYEKGRADE